MYRKLVNQGNQKKVETSVTAIIKTFNRPDHVRRLWESIRQHYSCMPIVIVDDSKEITPQNWDEYTSYVQMPYDSGLSAGRNRGVQEAITPYVLLLDDDFVFTDKTKIEVLLKVIEKEKLDIVAGEVVDFGSVPISFQGCMVVRDNMLFLNNDCVISYQNNYPLYDYVVNFFLAKREALLRSPWHDVLKIREHEAFFWQAKQKGLKITSCPSVKIDHFSASMQNSSKEYLMMRQERARLFHQKACDIIGVRGFYGYNLKHFSSTMYYSKMFIKRLLPALVPLVRTLKQGWIRRRSQK